MNEYNINNLNENYYYKGIVVLIYNRNGGKNFIDLVKMANDNAFVNSILVVDEFSIDGSLTSVIDDFSLYKVKVFKNHNTTDRRKYIENIVNEHAYCADVLLYLKYTDYIHQESFNSIIDQIQKSDNEGWMFQIGTSYKTVFRAVMVNKFYGFENDLIPELNNSLVQENTSILYGIDLYDVPDLIIEEAKFYIEYLNLFRDEERFLYPEYWILGYHMFDTIHDEEFLKKLEMKKDDFLRKAFHLMKIRTCYRMNPYVAHDILNELFWKPGETLDRFSLLNSIEFYDVLTPIDVYNEFKLMFTEDLRLDLTHKNERIYSILNKFITSLNQLFENPFSKRYHNIDSDQLWKVVIPKFLELCVSFGKMDLGIKIFESAKSQNHWGLFDESVMNYYNNFFYND
jgi:hypothetical protein